MVFDQQNSICKPEESRFSGGETKSVQFIPVKNVGNAPPENKKRRYTIDLTVAAAAEVDRIQQIFDLSAADIFRFALLLIRIHTDAKIEGKKVQIVDPRNPSRVETITLPLFPPAAV